MMGEHLHVILALRFNVDHQDLLDPEAPLDKVVPLEEAVGFSEGPALPDAVEIKPKFRMVHDVLFAR